MGDSSEAREMSFLEHLEELRWCVVKSLIAVGVCAIPCGIFWKQIFDLVMVYPLRLADPRPQIIYTSPAETILFTIKVAVTGGIILAAPVVFYQIWRFIAPGLYKREKRVILPAVIASTLCFLLGITFSYLTIPFVISFLARLAQGRIEPFYRITEYLGFLVKMSLAFGIVFELPVFSFVLTKFGILTPRFLIANIRYAIVAVFLVAALLTPPDVVSQVFLALPLIILYAVSILVSHLAGGKPSD